MARYVLELAKGPAAREELVTAVEERGEGTRRAKGDVGVDGGAVVRGGQRCQWPSCRWLMRT